MFKGCGKGFTLLELMIATTITAVIVVIIFGALRIGIRAWEKGERDVDGRQMQRVALEMVRRQLASVSATEAWGSERQPITLKGDDKSIEFISNIPMTPGSPYGPVYVRYAVKPDKNDGKVSLVFYEKNFAFLDKMKMEADKPDEDAFAALLSGMQSIVFEYLRVRPDEEASPWQKSWDPAVDKGVPRAVRITVAGDDATPPLYVIAAAAE